MDMQSKATRRILLVVGVMTIVGLFVAFGFSFSQSDTVEVDTISTDDDKLISASPLIYENTLMSISYGADPETGLKANDDIIITASASYRAAALRLLISQGISPAEHKIIFTDAEDVFAKYD